MITIMLILGLQLASTETTVIYRHPACDGMDQTDVIDINDRQLICIDARRVFDDRIFDTGFENENQYGLRTSDSIQNDQRPTEAMGGQPEPEQRTTGPAAQSLANGQGSEAVA